MGGLKRRSIVRGIAWTTGVIVALVLILAFFPWNALRGPLADYAGRRIDRPVRIDGDLNVHLSFTPRIEVNDVTIGNVTWSDVQPMAHVAHADVQVTLFSLLTGHLNVPSIALREAAVILERNADGAANWAFGNSQGPSTTHVGGVYIERGELRYRDPTLRLDVTSSIDSASPPGDANGGLRFSGKGTYRDEPFAIEGTGMGLNALREVDQPYRLNVHATAGATQAGFDGTIVPAKPQDVSGTLSLKGPDLSKLYPIVPAKLPWTPRYSLAGLLAHEGATWRFSQIEGRVGKSDLAGEFSVDLSSQRPAVAADLTSRQMHYQDLGGFVGLPPGEPGVKAQTAEQRQVEIKRQAKQSALEGKPFDTAGLRGFDADVKFRGRNVSWSRFPIDNLNAHMVLRDGLMTLQPLDFGIADGHVVSRFVFDLKQPSPKMEGQFEIRNVELKRLFPQLASPRGSAGRFGGYGKFQTQGDSLKKLLANGDGQGAVIMRGGEASTLALVLTNLDLAQAAGLLFRGKDETSEVRCAVSAFSVEDGVATPSFMVIDTSVEKITTTGKVDFHDEKYDLYFKAQSKRPSPLALGGPIVVGGTFKQPSVHPAVVPLLGRVGAAVGLGMVAPPLALLALVDFGGATDADCRGLMEEAKESVDASAKAPARRPPTTYLGKR